MLLFRQRKMMTRTTAKIGVFWKGWRTIWLVWLICFLSVTTASSDNDAGATAAARGTCNTTDNTSKSKTSKSTTTTCGVWMAKSTIPGAGLGLFAGRDIAQADVPILYGDLTIPAIDMVLHNTGEYETMSADDSDLKFIWNDYSWYPADVYAMEEDGRQIDCISPGFGAAVNCHLGLINLDYVAHNTAIDNAGLHRSKDPGAGAFTPFHNRTFITIDERPVRAGDELFVDYGTSYFEGRTKKYGLLPLNDHHWEGADALLQKYAALSQQFPKSVPPQVHQDLFALMTQEWPWKSRVLAALPESYEDVDRILGGDGGSRERDAARSRKSLEDLQRNGKCMDNIRPGNSTIPQAGRGAFATRFLHKGSVISPSPVLHIADRRRYDIYAFTGRGEDGYYQNASDRPVHKQLLLNYCFGHKDSSLLLSPYGALNLFINHSHKNPNARVVWSEESFMAHPEWLTQPVEGFAKEYHAGLSIDYIALRDIEPGEEILIDYGSAWEQAWQEHVQNWVPPEGATAYRSASDLNADQSSDLPTSSEMDEDESLRQSRANVRLYINIKYLSDHHLSDHQGKYECSIVGRYNETISDEKTGDAVSRTVYSANVVGNIDDIHGNGTLELENLPREAFYYRDLPYTRDHSQFWS